MNFTDNNITYTLPLDTMDLNYVLSKSRNQDKVLPIWNVNDNKLKEFYEIKIFAQHRGETAKKDLNKDDGDHLTYNCKICNVDIPKAFQEQHTSSDKHKTCLKIIEIALDKLKNHLTAVEVLGEAKVVPRSYFCEPCAVVVKEVKRLEHVLTRSHFKSLMHDKFLYDLLQIFIDKEHLENVDFEYMTNEHFNKNNVINSPDDSDSYTTTDYDDDDDDEDIIVAETSDLKENNVETTGSVENLKSDQNVGRKSESVTKNIKNPTNLEEYVQMINATRKLSTAPLISVKGDQVRIVSTDKHVLCVPEDHFHGFTRKEKWVTCKLCLKEVADEDSHKMTKEHIKWLFTPIPDKHGIREEHSIFKHCLLCNDHFFDLQQHKQSITHMEALEDNLEIVVKPPNKVNQPQTSPKLLKRYCQPCSSYVDMHNYNSHIRGKLHLSKAKQFTNDNNQPNLTNPNNLKQYCKPCSSYIHAHNYNSHKCGKLHLSNAKLFEGRTKEDAALISSHRHHLKLNKNNLLATCTVCNMVLDDMKSHSHVLSSLHVTNYNNLLAENNITNIEGMMLYCISCDLPIKDEKDLLHINSTEHKINLNCVDAAKPHVYNCKICKVKVPNTRSNIDSHNNGKLHRNIVMSKQVKK